MNLEKIISIAARKLLSTGQDTQSDRWQGVELGLSMFEAIKIYLGPVQMPETIQNLGEQTKANLPWAEEHFIERVGGLPLNPGETYKKWPFYGRDKEMRNVGGLFTHTYMERFWPKVAGKVTDDQMKEHGDPLFNSAYCSEIHKGIRFNYGDYLDVVAQIVKDPNTRQAFLPIFFPEDTGALHGGRVPCTIGYLFQYRKGYLHITYYIRSCDFLRHFRDDIYLTVRLAQDCLLKLKMNNSYFSGTKIGAIDMHIGSLHIFYQERRKVAKQFNLEHLI